MRFAHMADCHIGGWRDQKLNDLNTDAFFTAIDICIKEKVDFILIAGDLFNTALPGIDKLKDVVKRFKDLKDKDIPVYLIPGSHDFSPSGKTMLDVLEEAGLCINVVKGNIENGKLKLKFTIDTRTGAKITGMLGRRGMLERSYYEDLDRNSLEYEQGFKIFLFHTSLSELKPSSMDRMESSPISLLPKGFEYYAGGHVHIVERKDLPGYKNVVYPGPLFPNNYHELEELKKGGFYIYDDGKIIRRDVELKKVIDVCIEATNKTPQSVASEILNSFSEIRDCIVMMKIQGTLDGKISEINFKMIFDRLYEKGAFFVMRNTSSLTSREFEEVKINPGVNVEEDLIDEHAGQMPLWKVDKEKEMIKALMHLLGSEKKEGEKVYEFESRLLKDLEKALHL
ncbi:MAG: exonuclease SbcCD subunit D [Candidatus Woesearchaeota archaeon]|nr:exonuclease SbcCD subunit D [Candidatus Woesearchaeota archaeon]